MIYFILILLFVALFVFITWRIVAFAKSDDRKSDLETYVCPVCDDRHCDCHKKHPQR